jgi:nucleotide-binding universal stress UspA family protein
VVGIADPEIDAAALPWAAIEARLLEVPLLIVHAAVRMPRMERSLAAHPAGTGAVTQADIAARSVIAEAIRHVRAISPPELPVSGEVADGTPAAVLLRMAAQARMIVLGSRRLGGWGSFLLGSNGRAAR